jgi:hypothetical protein
MKRILRILLVVGLLTGGLALCSPSAEAGPFGRGGPFRRGGWGGFYGPGRGYGAYRPVGWGYGAYRPVGWGYGAYRPWGYGAYGWGYPAYGVGYPGYGFPAYPGYYGTSISVGNPMGGFYMSSYPY